MKYFEFCPYCGCNWEGEIKWDIQRKWTYGHGQHEAARRAREERVRPLKFKVQKRFIPLDNKGEDFEYKEAGPWEYQHNNLRDAIVAAQALKELNKEEDDEDDHMFGKFEYRVVPEEKK